MGLKGGFKRLQRDYPTAFRGKLAPGVAAESEMDDSDTCRAGRPWRHPQVLLVDCCLLLTSMHVPKDMTAFQLFQWLQGVVASFVETVVKSVGTDVWPPPAPTVVFVFDELTVEEGTGRKTNRAKEPCRRKRRKVRERSRRSKAEAEVETGTAEPPEMTDTTLLARGWTSTYLWAPAGRRAFSRYMRLRFRTAMTMAINTYVFWDDAHPEGPLYIGSEPTGVEDGSGTRVVTEHVAALRCRHPEADIGRIPWWINELATSTARHTDFLVRSETDAIISILLLMESRLANAVGAPTVSVTLQARPQSFVVGSRGDMLYVDLNALYGLVAGAALHGSPTHPTLNVTTCVRVWSLLTLMGGCDYVNTDDGLAGMTATRLVEAHGPWLAAAPGRRPIAETARGDRMYGGKRAATSIATTFYSTSVVQFLLVAMDVDPETVSEKAFNSFALAAFSRFVNAQWSLAYFGCSVERDFGTVDPVPDCLELTAAGTSRWGFADTPEGVVFAPSVPRCLADVFDPLGRPITAAAAAGAGAGVGAV